MALQCSENIHQFYIIFNMFLELALVLGVFIASVLVLYLKLTEPGVTRREWTQLPDEAKTLGRN